MSLQHREFVNRLRDAERLRLYVQSWISTQESLELEAKEVADKAARVEEERDAARHETEMAWLETEAVDNARA